MRTHQVNDDTLTDSPVADADSVLGQHRIQDRNNWHSEGSSIPDAEFITIPEWARRVGISHESGYKAARLGEIPGCFVIGRLYRVNWPVFVARAGADHG